MRTPTCCICGREIEPGQKYAKSKPKGRPEVYACEDCLKKKEADSDEN
jgi:hypothetical protein